jgi:hypothetical protein
LAQSLRRAGERGGDLAERAKDVEECPKCHGRLRLIQSITEPALATAILDRLGISYETPLVARARDPTDDEARDDDDT